MIFIGVISNYVNEIDQINDLFEELLNRTEESEKKIVVNQLHASQPNDSIKDNIEDRSDRENEDENRADSYKIIKMEI